MLVCLAVFSLLPRTMDIRQGYTVVVGALVRAVVRQIPQTAHTVSGEGAERMCNRGPGRSWFLGVLAVALGAGILIAAIFPVGALMFLVAILLIACGLACCKR